MSFRICDYARPVVSDIDLSIRLDAEQFDHAVNKCVARATETLKGSASPYSEWDRSHIGSIIEAMQISHKSIRVLLRPEEPSPTSIDALPLTRIQLESLYAICLMLEDPQWVGDLH